MSIQKNKGEIRNVNDRISLGLMMLAALGAAYAFVSAIGVALTAGPETQQVEWWRAFGFLLFTVLFIMLAIKPRAYPGLWELIILDKAGLTVVEFWLISNDVVNAQSTAIVDGVLTVIILAAYLLAQGYRSWRR
ncbi:MAG: hypothetical protein LWX83_01390 [Anaerolineae bacterium]|nr:hypothetical protein [Anaerolineae bacterium]